MSSARGDGQLNLRSLAHFAILSHGDFPYTLLIHEVCQGNLIEETVDLLTEIIPQLMSQALVTLLAVTRAFAARGLDRFIHGRDDLGNRNPLGGAAE